MAEKMKTDASLSKQCQIKKILENFWLFIQFIFISPSRQSILEQGPGAQNFI